MIKIGLDLAVRTCGIAIQNGEFLSYFSFKSDEKDYLELQIEMINWIFEKIKTYLEFEHQLIMEGIYSGINPKAAINAARIQGGVIQKYHALTAKFPTIVSPVTARNRADIPVQISKAEIQSIIVKKFNLGNISSEIDNEIIRLRNGYDLVKERKKKAMSSASKIMKARLIKEQAKAKRDMNNGLKRLSTRIKKETGVDEHCADALVLIIGNHG